MIGVIFTTALLRAILFALVSILFQFSWNCYTVTVHFWQYSDLCESFQVNPQPNVNPFLPMST